jgi:glycosyltransferase involved in cell wall biosynthesis
LSNSSEKMAVLIPARNEAQSLGIVIAGIRDSSPDVEIVVVNSDSTDDTKPLAKKLGATVVDQNGSGYAGALRVGYRYLAANGFTKVVQIDADGQHPPADIPRLFSALSQSNWVIGSRANTDSVGALDRKLGNAFLSILVRLTTGETIRDVTSGFWGLDTEALSLFSKHFPTQTADANVRVLGIKLGLKICEIPVTMNDRLTGESMHDGMTGVKNFARSVVAIKDAAALHIKSPLNR